MSKRLHIVSFDVPYPPNYGGVIDIFYKIKELYKLGIEIYLHIYISDDKEKQIALEKYCKKIYYYNRKSTFYSLLSYLPFRVKSRSNRELTQNLKNLEIPILFEGLHSMYALSKFNFKNSYLRAHNIEHTYFFGLSKSEKNILKKIFFFIEGRKLKRFEKNLKNATGIFTISPFEQDYFARIYTEKSHYIPAFHEAKFNLNHSKKGQFVLFHGDLRVADNIKAALFLIDTYKNTEYKFVIATSILEKRINSEVHKYDNISIEDIPTQNHLDELMKKAHINTLFSFQKTGIKLKLLNTLYRGKFIIANSPLIEDTGLESLCNLANSKEEILKTTAALFSKDYLEIETQNRISALQKFNPTVSAKKIVAIIFKT